MYLKMKIMAALVMITALCAADSMCYAQSPSRQNRRNQTPQPQQPQQVRRYHIEGGVLREVGTSSSKDNNPSLLHARADSLVRRSGSLRDSVRMSLREAGETLAGTGATLPDELSANADDWLSQSDSLTLNVRERLAAADSRYSAYLQKFPSDTLQIDSLAADGVETDTLQVDSLTADGVETAVEEDTEDGLDLSEVSDEEAVEELIEQEDGTFITAAHADSLAMVAVRASATEHRRAATRNMGLLRTAIPRMQEELQQKILADTARLEPDSTGYSAPRRIDTVRIAQLTAADSLLGRTLQMASAANSALLDAENDATTLENRIFELEKAGLNPVLETDTVTEVLSRRDRLRLERQSDPEKIRYNILRDTIPLSRMTALSFVLPGYSQYHNKQYWKIPVLYATAGTAIYFGLQQNKHYNTVRKHYDLRVAYGYDRETTDLDEVQRVMIKYNTRRQLLFGAAIVSYIYFIGDGIMNYPGENARVKMATTLSTIIPGAGQIYNRSYWKVPIVMGGFATMAYMIDWNNRGYKRFGRAFDLVNDGDDNTHSEFYYNGNEYYTAQQLLNWRKSYRRNRDLCIIITGAVYLLNVIDAHVDSHMKEYDISDDLNVTLRPSLGSINTQRTGSGTTVGFTMNLTF